MVTEKPDIFGNPHSMASGLAGRKRRRLTGAGANLLTMIENQHISVKFYPSIQSDVDHPLLGFPQSLVLEGTKMNIRNKIVGAISMGFISLATLSGAHAFPTSGSVSISGDRGGYVVVYALRMLKLKESGKPVQFRGRCDSACTLYLALPARQVCVAPRTSFNFHLPYGASPRGNRFAASYMLKSYPGWVRTWVRSKGGLSNKMISMNYAYASKFLPTCKGSFEVADNSTSRVRGLVK